MDDKLQRKLTHHYCLNIFYSHQDSTSHLKHALQTIKWANSSSQRGKQQLDRGFTEVRISHHWPWATFYCMLTHLIQEQCISEHTHHRKQLPDMDPQQLFAHVVHPNLNHLHSHCCIRTLHHLCVYHLSTHFQGAVAYALCE